MTYQEKLKSPRWQKKRLDILERDNFTCRSCKNTVFTLHVHHLNYKRNRDPWEYQDYELITLCEYCHDQWHLLDKTDGITWEMLENIGKLYNDLETENMKRFINNSDINE